MPFSSSVCRYFLGGAEFLLEITASAAKALMKAFAKKGQWKDAEELLTEMQLAAVPQCRYPKFLQDGA